MKKESVILLARELFKIRLVSSREGYAQEDGVHKMEIKGITSYNHEVIEKWYKESLETAEMIVALEDEYLSSVSPQGLQDI